MQYSVNIKISTLHTLPMNGAEHWRVNKLDVKNNYFS